MKEIGGYFGLEQLNSDKGEYYKDLIALNTARNALVYLIKAKKIKKIYIPYMLCDSVSKVCNREGFKYEYYHIDEFLRPIFANQIKENEYLYIGNLYGQISNNEIIIYKEKYKNIIIDNTHAFFQEPVKGVDTIYSCRKFFGVPDGAYLSTNVILDEELKQDNSEDRTKHIYGRIKDGATAHYDEFKANDESFKELELKTMSELTHKMLSVIDYEKIKQIRKENYLFLYQQLNDINKLKLSIPDGPFAYPFYCENGMEIKRKLAEEKVYVATLWPNILDCGEILEKDYAENILPLPCDQRLKGNDIKLIIDKIFTMDKEKRKKQT